MTGSCPVSARVCQETAKERDELRRWKAEALPVLDGLQELGKALGLPLGSRITGREALAAVERLTRERDDDRRVADIAVDQKRRLLRERDEARAEAERLRSLATWLTRLDEPDDIEERLTVTLTKIIDRARVALNPQGRRPEEGQPRPMPEFSPERARLLAERPAHPWTPPEGTALHSLEDVAEEFGVDLTEGENR